MQVVSKMASHPIVVRSYPIVMDMLVPVGLSVGAWAILPKLLRRVHDSVERGSAQILHPGKKPDVSTPYDLSLWSALEEPCRLFATFLFLSQLGAIVAPTTFASSYMRSIWSGGSVASVIWFLQRWKRNVITRFLKDRKLSNNEKERYSALDQISSLILLFVGALGLAEASGVAVQSLLTVGGIGGVATAFAARDILGNILSGVSLIFSKPFSTGDFIKAGSVEGKVEEVGIHSTRLLNNDKIPVVVPNSFFSSEVIINKSKAPWRAMSLKVPVRIQDFEKIDRITGEVRHYLDNHSKVYMGEDKPRCSVSKFGSTAIEVVITCNVQPAVVCDQHIWCLSTGPLFKLEDDVLIINAMHVLRNFI